MNKGLVDGCIPNWETAPFSPYRYEPSVVGNSIFVGIFAVTSILHLLQMCKTRTWYLTPLVLGSFCECVGYTGRLIGALETPGCWTKDWYIVQTVLILVAPALMAASVYMILGRIILLTESEKYSMIRRSWLTKIFVSGDVTSLILQTCGGVMVANGNSVQTGENIVTGGLFIQLTSLATFIIVAAVFNWRMARAPTPRANDPAVRWGWYLGTLYVASGLIWVRSLVRVIEFIEGSQSPLMDDEVYVFVFDGLLMAIVLLWLNWFHPSEIGLLLRGFVPATNGFQLFTTRAQPAKGAVEGSSFSSGGSNGKNNNNGNNNYINNDLSFPPDHSVV